MAQRKPERIFADIFALIEDATERFRARAKTHQNKIFREVQLLIKGLDLDKKGNLKQTVKNLKQVRRINGKVAEIVENPGYIKDVQIFVDKFKRVSNLQDEAFSALVGKFGVPKIAQEMQKLAVDEAVNSLTQAGLERNVADKVRTTIDRNIREAASFEDLNKDINRLLTDKGKTQGALVGHTHQITQDSINQHAANYTKLISEDLGIEWYLYTGSLVKDSREFCVEMVGRGYIHVSQLPAVSNAIVPGVGQVSTQGMVPGTNADNILIFRGGFNCNHQFIPIAKEAVPADIRKEFEE